jgi:hypothetical protein
VCAFLRGEDVLVVVAVRPAGEESEADGGPVGPGPGAGRGVAVPAGRWRGLLGGEAGGAGAGRGPTEVGSLVEGPWPGLGLYERA